MKNIPIEVTIETEDGAVLVGNAKSIDIENQVEEYKGTGRQVVQQAEVKIVMNGPLADIFVTEEP